MRASDRDFGTSPDVESYQKWRDIRTWGGLIVTVGGILFACLIPNQATLGMIVALLGAGVIEPTQVMSFFTKR